MFASDTNSTASHVAALQASGTGWESAEWAELDVELRFSDSADPYAELLIRSSVPRTSDSHAAANGSEPAEWTELDVELSFLA